jgi:hypothetical protein
MIGGDVEAQTEEERMAGTVDYEKALKDPAAAFATPGAIVEAASLSKEQKVALLRQWEYDESELAVATEEGMPGNGSRLLQEIGRALAVLDPEGDDRPAPSKQRVPPSP